MLDKRFLETIGVYEGANGTYYRDRPRIRSFEYDATDPDAVRKGLVVAYEEELVPHPVVLPLATDPESIAEAQAKARTRGHDFYHPTWGWLRWGVKREQEHPENLGNDANQYRRRRVVVGDAPLPAPEPAVASRKGT